MEDSPEVKVDDIIIEEKSPTG